jgi:DNA-binding response OmpR family regulator
VLGLKLGADDCLTKPFDMMELTARIEVQVRWRAAAASNRRRSTSSATSS